MTLAQLVNAHPAAIPVLLHYGIDFTWHGDRTVVAACAEVGLPVPTLLDEIREEEDSGGERLERWDEEPLVALIAHIEAVHHRKLDQTLPRLEELASDALEAHEGDPPSDLVVLAKTLQLLVDDLATHMAREERTLFPAIRQSDNAGAIEVLKQLEQEHDEATEALGTLRSLTNGYQLPAGADDTIRELWVGLEELEQELRVHIHLENNVLFPRVVEIYGQSEESAS